MRIATLTAVLVLLSIVCTGMGIGAQADEQVIRDSRARSNAAIAAHDIAGIARAWVNIKILNQGRLVPCHSEIAPTFNL